MEEAPNIDPRAVWLRSLGWRETGDDAWTGPVVATRGGRYKPMSLAHAFEVSIKRSVIDGMLHVEIAAGGVRLASDWREIAAPASAAKARVA
jgi:hypothetical protein